MKTIETLALRALWVITLCAKPFLPETNPFKRMSFRQFQLGRSDFAVDLGIILLICLVCAGKGLWLLVEILNR
ncbi:MAG: hypothetical protein WC763_00840 [Candidatus Paceibacterota bacterium]|jgi:hypothetical protein